MAATPSTTAHEVPSRTAARRYRDTAGGTAAGETAAGESGMDNDELLAVLRGDIAGVNQRIDDTRLYLGARIDEAKSDLGARIDEVKSDLGGRIDETNKRIDETNKRIDEARSDLGGRIEEVKSDLGGRIDEVKSDLGSRIDETKSDLGIRIDDTNRRIDAVDQFRLQGAALVVALAAAIAVVGTFVLQVLAVL